MYRLPAFLNLIGVLCCLGSQRNFYKINRTRIAEIRATFTDISYLISKEFILLLLIAGILGSIMGYFSVKAFMSSIWAYYVDFGILPFILSALLLFILAILTVSSQVFSVATSNPTDSLRYE